MTTNEPTASHPLLANRHLKESKDCLASEQQALYQLRCKHGLERDLLRVERVTDTRRRLDLLAQQAQEIDQLSQQQYQLRLAILARQAAEVRQLKHVS